MADIEALAICGPTAAGKSDVAMRVAKLVGGEIVNADSRQVYRDMPIGTGMPDDRAMLRVPHHLYAYVDPCARFSAGAYVPDALGACAAIANRGRLPIVVGGTGLYVDALRGAMPLDRPFADDAIRARVRAEALVHPHEALRAWLESIAPVEAGRSMPGDAYRTIRALEGVLAARSHHAAPARGEQVSLRLRLVVLDVDRDELARRIAIRVRAMFAGGIVDEALAIWRRCGDVPSLTGLGYAEALAYDRGEASREEAIRSAIARTCRYAKRQRTWFRRMRDAVAISGADPRTAAAAIAALARETVPRK